MILSLMSFKQHFNYILTFQYYSLFVEFPWFPSFRFWAQNENSDIQKIFIFLVFSSQAISNEFCLFLSFIVVNNAITLFNWFFRGFRDFRVFDLAG